MMDDLEQRARTALAALLSIDSFTLTALHERWSGIEEGNNVTIESPVHPEGWCVTLVTPGWPLQIKYEFKASSEPDAIRLALNWIDERHS